MIQYLYLGRVDYQQGLQLQSELSALISAGRLANVLLLLEHPPVLTLGRNANRANVLASDEILATRGITLHEINRGGDVTYHGPGQLVGYPLFDLRTLKNANGGRLGPVDFVRGLEEVLIRVCAQYGVHAERMSGLTGVWCGVQPAASESPASPFTSHGSEQKIAAIGIHVAKGITSHGFAFNIATDLRDFQLIVPCGIADHGVTSLAMHMENPALVPALQSVAHQAARQFGLVFAQQVLAVDSIDTLRAQANTREFPADDTPLKPPPEIERLRGVPAPPVRA
jgi:lipoyl(octanoyl) transferase